jgi:arabinoxylan arabinofuranohydrolase
MGGAAACASKESDPNGPPADNSTGPVTTVPVTTTPGPTGATPPSPTPSPTSVQPTTPGATGSPTTPTSTGPGATTPGPVTSTPTGPGPVASTEPTSGPEGSSTDVTSSDEPTEEPSNCVPNPRARAHNPLVTHIFTADPNAVVYGDRVYLYVSHDVDNQDNYYMVDYRGFSSDDMVNWQDHGVLIHTDSLPWATYLYAPGACAKNGKYYLYIPTEGDAIGVAVADDPGGPFVDPLGKPLLTKDFPNADVLWLFDPACFVDDDGQGYLYFGGGNDGGQNARVIRLNDDMVSFKDERATTVPTVAFFEAAFVHKHEGIYYLNYSSDFIEGYHGSLEYLTSDNPMTGWTHRGRLLPNTNDINRSNNNHGSIIDYKGKTYLFYHQRKLEQELKVDKKDNRSVAVQEITYGPNNTLNATTMSREDFTVSQLKCLNGFKEVQAETLAGEKGIEVEGKAGETVYVDSISNNDWVGYSQVDFRDGATKLVLRVASQNGGGKIDVRIDGCLQGQQGTSIGECTVAATGGNTTYANLTCEIQGPAGPHDLCLHFSENPAFRFDSWHLEE